MSKVIEGHFPKRKRLSLVLVPALDGNRLETTIKSAD
jgi:hypothetical protein